MRFERVLVANRGEIAVRIAQACQELGCVAVAAYSDADEGGLHTRVADSVARIGPAAAAESYLDAGRIVRTALAVGAEAVHPGYGFLSESADLAERCAEAGLAFVGPSPETLRTVGCKMATKGMAERAGVRSVPWARAPVADEAALLEAGRLVGFPLVVKAAAGGGGRGIRRVDAPDALLDAARRSAREAATAFGSDELFLERLILGARHVEVQILADAFGGVIHLGERDCSVQRRHQKVIEESPAVGLPEELRARLHDWAVRVAREAAYVGAGTVEFLVAPDGNGWLLEVNPRIQVEHPVTEMVAGIDLVGAQLRIAAGERLWVRQEDVGLRGHSIECRVCAEDPGADFAPSPGRLVDLHLPSGAHVRVDSGYESGDTIPMEYDSLVAKLIVWGEDRTAAIRRMRLALSRTAVMGVRDNVSLLRAVVEDEEFARGGVDTGFLERRLGDFGSTGTLPLEFLAAAALADEAPAPAPDLVTPRATFGPWQSLSGFRNVPAGEQ